MPLSKPLKTASYLLRLTPEDKARLEAKAADCHLTLADALRQGAEVYLDELREEHQQRGRSRTFAAP